MLQLRRLSARRTVRRIKSYGPKSANIEKIVAKVIRLVVYALGKVADGEKTPSARGSRAWHPRVANRGPRDRGDQGDEGLPWRIAAHPMLHLQLLSCPPSCGGETSRYPRTHGGVDQQLMTRKPVAPTADELTPGPTEKSCN